MHDTLLSVSYGSLGRILNQFSVGLSLKSFLVFGDALTSNRERIRQSFERLLFPLRHLIGVDSIKSRNLIGCL